MEDCSTVCKSKQALRWHKQKNHGYKMFNCKCTICDETFSNGWSLYWHKKRKHGILKKEDSDESQEKVSHKAESLASPKLSISDDSSIDVLQSISGINLAYSCFIPSLHFLQDTSRFPPPKLVADIDLETTYCQTPNSQSPQSVTLMATYLVIMILIRFQYICLVAKQVAYVTHYSLN